jgi:hypothetical protein
VLISGDGIGAGKSTLARRLGTRVSLADELRAELQEYLPGYDWFNRSQAYKAETAVLERSGKSVRQVMIEYGQDRCAESPTYWADRLIRELRGVEALNHSTYAVDDVRKLCEVEALKTAFPGTVHLHITSPHAQHEPEFENAALAAVADFTVSWSRKLDPEST